jgi:LysR family glycine cleavage system transcriptional activator
MAHHRSLPLGPLRVFDSAARTLSFTRTGAELHLTQSAVSRQVQALEAALGVSLFLRKTRALVLTREGNLLARAAAEALQRLDDAAREISEVPRRQVLVVSTWSSFASIWLVPRLARFQRLAPEIDVRISSSDSYVDLLRERIDLAIRYTLRQPLAPEATVLFEERVFPVASPELLRQRGKGLRTVADLARHTLLHLHDRLPWRQVSWEHWLGQCGHSGIVGQAALTYDQSDQLLKAAALGHGVALARSFLVQDMLAQGELVAPLAPPRAPVLDTGGRCHLVLSPRSADRPEVKRFVGWLQSEVRSVPAEASAHGPP